MKLYCTHVLFCFTSELFGFHAVIGDIFNYQSIPLSLFAIQLKIKLLVGSGLLALIGGITGYYIAS